MQRVHPLKEWLHEPGQIRRAELARRVGVSQSHLLLVAEGKRGVSLALALRLSTETGIPVKAFDAVKPNHPAQAAAE